MKAYCLINPTTSKDKRFVCKYWFTTKAQACKFSDKLHQVYPTRRKLALWNVNVTGKSDIVYPFSDGDGGWGYYCDTRVIPGVIGIRPYPYK